MKRQRPVVLTQASLEQAALRYLERFASSREQVRRVLMRRIDRAAQDGEVDRQAWLQWTDRLMDRLQDTGLIDDFRFAEGRVATLRRRGDSRHAIAAKLAQKGVDPETVAEALETIDNDAGPDAELLAARALVRRRRLGQFRPAETMASFHDRDLAVLARAGFSLTVARQALRVDEEDDR